jgi:hypothetical protein
MVCVAVICRSPVAPLVFNSFLIITFVPLVEELRLPPGIRGRANPKSSTGRLDVFTRVITDAITGTWDSLTHPAFKFHTVTEYTLDTKIYLATLLNLIIFLPLAGAVLSFFWAGDPGRPRWAWALPGFLLADAVSGARVPVLALTWVFTLGGLALSYYAALTYVPQARAALREGRGGRSEGITA